MEKLRYPDYWMQDSNIWGDLNNWDLYWMEMETQPSSATREDSHITLLNELKHLKKIYKHTPIAHVVHKLKKELKKIDNDSQNKETWEESEAKLSTLHQANETQDIKFDDLEMEEEQNEPSASTTKGRKNKLKWNLFEDLKPTEVEWMIDGVNISHSFFRFKEHAEFMAKGKKLTYSKHPGEILALSSILLLEENSKRAELDIPADIRTNVFDQMKIIYQKHDLPREVKELCYRCARRQSRHDLKKEIDDAFYDLNVIGPSDERLLRISRNVWIHIEENWCSSFNKPRTIEDTYAHHSLHPLLRLFFPDSLDQTVDWANKMSIVSSSRKVNDKGEGHKSNFMLTATIRKRNYELMFGLFKSPSMSTSYLVNVDLVDLGVLMKDSLDDMYKAQRIELDMAVFGIHAFGMYCNKNLWEGSKNWEDDLESLTFCLAGYNVRIYVMDLSYDAVYRMYLLGEFALSRSNIDLCLVENGLYEVENLESLIEEYIKRLSSLPLTNNNGNMAPTNKMRMTRKTVETPRYSP
ncbi:5127_t:CDS:10 [Ambispora gerdemannii]|uniref:5127_t:CDS:1 n=1 Tax=Ambispora gerdemannii TaxID=144530 RepID=A0A9N9F5C2_9GLOM|nr:5127_t:CDS:10 [Ambispora gerdemannii]